MRNGFCALKFTMEVPLAWYDAQLAALPLFTKTWTAIVLYVLGDVANQRWSWLEKAPRSRGDYAFDYSRTTRMAVWASIATAPNALWYLFLDANEGALYGVGVSVIVQKIALDQFVWSPPISMAFFVFDALAQGASWLEAAALSSPKVFPVLRISWLVWPCFHAVTYTLIPLRYRMLWINACMVAWSAILSRRAAA